MNIEFGKNTKVKLKALDDITFGSVIRNPRSPHILFLVCNTHGSAACIARIDNGFVFQDGDDDWPFADSDEEVWEIMNNATLHVEV